MPRMIQLHVSWAESQEEAEEQAVKEWPNGGMPFPKADIRNPEDFAAMAKLVSIENFKNRVLMCADLDEHLEHIQHYVDLGFDEVYVHNVGRNQEEFIEAYGERVIPKLDWPEEVSAGLEKRRLRERLARRPGGCALGDGRHLAGAAPGGGVAVADRALEHLVLLLYSVPAVVLGWRFFRGLGAAQWAALLVIGWGGSALATLLFTTAFAVGNPTVAILLQKTQPLFAVALAGILLRERLGWAYWPCFRGGAGGGVHDLLRRPRAFRRAGAPPTPHRRPRPWRRAPVGLLHRAGAASSSKTCPFTP